MQKTLQNTSQMRLYNARRERLYVNKSERQSLLALAPKLSLKWQTLLLTLLYTGCRASETLELTPNSLQAQGGVLAIRSLKKRHGTVVIREVPIPEELCVLLVRLRNQQQQDVCDAFWPISRKTVWRVIKHLMQRAEISGARANPKGLRHGFGVHAVHCGIDLGTIQKWMGHSRISVTIIYTNAIGQDERERARLMW